MKRLGVFLLSLDGMLVQITLPPELHLLLSIYTRWRKELWVRNWSLTAQSGVEHTNHEAMFHVDVYITVVFFLFEINQLQESGSAVQEILAGEHEWDLAGINCSIKCN